MRLVKAIERRTQIPCLPGNAHNGRCATALGVLECWNPTLYISPPREEGMFFLVFSRWQWEEMGSVRLIKKNVQCSPTLDVNFRTFHHP